MIIKKIIQLVFIAIHCDSIVVRGNCISTEIFTLIPHKEAGSDFDTVILSHQ